MSTEYVLGVGLVVRFLKRHYITIIIYYIVFVSIAPQLLLLQGTAALKNCIFGS